MADMFSQEEIDALLEVVEEEDISTPKGYKKCLSETLEEMEELCEMFNRFNVEGTLSDAKIVIPLKKALEMREKMAFIKNNLVMLNEEYK